MSAISEAYNSVNKAFSKQSVSYDAEDSANIILQDLRQQVYDHINKFIKPNSRILELNAGTGIDAMHFVHDGHTVHATDLSDGMINQINQKIEKYSLTRVFTSQQVSYDNLDTVQVEQKFDYVFSNFGGLNCVQDLSKVTRHLTSLVNTGAHVTFVIMPTVCPWELLWLLKGKRNEAFRRFGKNGVFAHLEGEYFKTFYFSLSDVKKAFGSNFVLVKTEGLASISPPPSKGTFPEKYPKLYSTLRSFDAFVRHKFPFNRWGDHIIVTLKFVG